MAPIQSIYPSARELSTRYTGGSPFAVPSGLDAILSRLKGAQKVTENIGKGLGATAPAAGASGVAATVAATADYALANFLNQAGFDPDELLQNAGTSQTKRINEIAKEALEEHPKNFKARANFFRNKIMSDDTTKDLAKGATRKGGLRGAWDKRMKGGLTKTDLGIGGVLAAAFLAEQASRIGAEAQQRSAAIEMMQQQTESLSPQDIATERMLPVMLSRAMGGQMAPPTASGEYLTLGG